jgi:hypothetical protein
MAISRLPGLDRCKSVRNAGQKGLVNQELKAKLRVGDPIGASMSIYRDFASPVAGKS